jgi:PII-like signaling protein
MTQAVLLRLFVPENAKHHGELLYEWILERAKGLNIPGGSAFRAIAGYGRHGAMHHAGFFELAPNLPVQVEFILPEPLARELLSLLSDQKVSVPYALEPVETGYTASKPPP